LVYLSNPISTTKHCSGQADTTIELGLRQNRCHCQPADELSVRPWAPPQASNNKLYIEHSKCKALFELVGPNGLARFERVRLGLYEMLPISEYGIRTHPAVEIYVMLPGQLLPRKGFRVSTTKADPLNAVAENKLDRDFSANKPNEKWVTDVTFLPTGEGWLYLAAMLDLYNREVVGWAMSKNNDAQLTLNALEMALEVHKPPKGCCITRTEEAPIHARNIEKHWYRTVLRAA